MLTAIVLIVDQNWFLSVSTGDVLKWWTFIWNYFNCVVLNASGHGAVAKNKGFILLVKNRFTSGRLDYHSLKINCYYILYICLKNGRYLRLHPNQDK